jgi:alkylation response protein AidB-like acyl-CoA dehydrogenase
MTAAELLRTARGLRELIESEAAQTEQNLTMTRPVVDALVESGLFRLLVPKELGGFEADPTSIIDVCEELAFADGSVGWAFAQNTTVLAYSAYLDRDYGRLVAAAPAGAGMFAPLGTAHKENRGFRVSGSYQFGSGCAHATFMGGGAMEMHDGEMPEFVDGLPLLRAYIVPMDRVELKGNWDVMGLQGTGSFDYDVPEQFVETAMTFSLFETTPTTGGALYGIGPVPLGTISSCAWALGVAERALHEIVEIVNGGRTRMGSNPTREQQVFQRELGMHMQALPAARLLACEAYGSAVDGIAAGATPEERKNLIRRTRAAATYVTEVAKAAVVFAYEASGSQGLRNPSRLQRCFRDIYAGASHLVFDERNYVEVAKVRLGLEPLPF